ncbi:uncharacterized protein LOC135117209, partial [Helicoverpa armigera]|uniref:uncharacterized protein LOC135117209 n=1 Tax=Helicoverpa armigera TaxID=29058 RepID=UPI0030827E60
INPFKVRIEVDNEFSANKIEKCQAFIDRNWNIQRAMERSSSYGVIRDVDLDLSDEDILKCISCKKPPEIISVYRLKRRDPEGIGWQPSEAVQVCFKGSFIPQYVYVEGLRIKVTPYLFPVSQCSKCWKYGHLYKKCPSSKVVCPKCGGPHENCETETFRCVNCSGKHMALAKNSCPVFLKEKKIREIMNEFNCTYRKALSVYVPPSPFQKASNHNTDPMTKNEIDFIMMNKKHILREVSVINSDSPAHIPTFSEIVKAMTSIPVTKKKVSPVKSSVKQNRLNDVYEIDPIISNSPPSTTGQDKTDKIPSQEHKKKSVNFEELLSRLKEIIFLRG